MCAGQAPPYALAMDASPKLTRKEGSSSTASRPLTGPQGAAPPALAAGIRAVVTSETRGERTAVPATHRTPGRST